MSNDALEKLAQGRKCPRCDFDKTYRAAICSSCRRQLPPNMRVGLESVDNYDPMVVQRAIRGAASYFDLHFQSIRNFIGKRKK